MAMSWPRGIPAHSFTLQDLDGKQVSLSDFKGKVVVLDFWATWCPPCVKEIPHFIELYEQYKDQGFAMVGISLDHQGVSVVKSFVRKYQVNYPILMADRQVQASYGEIKNIPTTFVIDAEGNLKRKYIGYRDKSVFEADIQTLLAEAKLGARPIRLEKPQRRATTDVKSAAEPYPIAGQDKILRARSKPDEPWLTKSLIQAVSKGDLEQVRLLISQGVDVNAAAADKVGSTPLQRAAAGGNKNVVELLIAKGADVNAKNRVGWTPLHLATIPGHKNIVELLINKGADVNAKPEIFNTDQGSQFTSDVFTGVLKDVGIAISMDGRGRVFDNIFVEHLWRSVKYEEVYLKDYGMVDEARQNLAGYFQFYNYERLHQSLGYLTPAEVYFGYEADLSCSASHSADSLGIAKVTI